MNSTSASAIWARIVEAVAQVMNTYLIELQNTQQVLTSSALSLRVGKADYYITKAKEFQPSGRLEVNPQSGVWEYTSQSDTIVTQASLQVVNGKVTLSVAKTGENGALAPLSASEVAALSDYIDLFSFVGIKVFVKTADADIISGELEISYDPTFSLEEIQLQVQEALQNAQTAYNLYEPVYVNMLESQVGQVQGVVNAYFGQVQVDSQEAGTTEYYSNKVTLPAGYFNFSADLLDGTSITYKAITDNAEI